MEIHALFFNAENKKLTCGDRITVYFTESKLSASLIIYTL